MNLPDVYELIRPSLVAFIPNHTPINPPHRNPIQFPPIVGTGFVVADGLIVTNAHVVKSLLNRKNLGKTKKQKWPFQVVLFHQIEKDKVSNAPASGIAAIPLEILGIIDVGEIQFPKSGYYYGPRRPDFSVIHVKMRELPCVDLLSDFSHLRVGDEVASLGYPMGTDLLTAPGWLHQLGPTLQRGIISAILPFPCKAPHSVLIDIMSLGGASGSPVFLANEPRIIGVLFAGLEESQVIFTPGQDETLQPVGMTKAATSLSYVVPAYYAAALLEKVQQNPISKLPPNTKTLNETLQEIEFVVRKTPGKHNEPPRPGKATTPELAEGIEGFVNISYLDEEEKL